MKLAGLVLLLIGLIGFGFSFSITGLIGFGVCIISIILVIAGIFTMIRSKNAVNVLILIKIKAALSSFGKAAFFIFLAKFSYDFLLISFEQVPRRPPPYSLQFEAHR